MFAHKLTPGLIELMGRYESRFGDGVPLEQVGGTIEDLSANIQRCLEADEDLLPEIYGWNYEEHLY